MRVVVRLVSAGLGLGEESDRAAGSQAEGFS